MNLNPEAWEIATYDGDVPRFVRLVETTVTCLDQQMSENVVELLNSVIGNQEYLSSKKRRWTWTIESLEVTYYHDKASDKIIIIRIKT